MVSRPSAANFGSLKSAAFCPKPLRPAPPSSTLHPLSSLLCISCLSWFLLCPSSALASPSSALREYKSGNYEQSLKEYERLLQKKSDDPRLHFNAGAAAYQNRQYDEAAKQFNWREKVKQKQPGVGYGLACGTEKNSVVAACAEIAVDPAKNSFSVRRVCEAFECGAILNPSNLASQVQGCIIMGMGQPVGRDAIDTTAAALIKTASRESP